MGERPHPAASGVASGRVASDSHRERRSASAACQGHSSGVAAFRVGIGREVPAWVAFQVDRDTAAAAAVAAVEIAVELEVVAEQIVGAAGAAAAAVDTAEEDSWVAGQ